MNKISQSILAFLEGFPDGLFDQSAFKINLFLAGDGRSVSDASLSTLRIS